jgi:hypothetical protein
LVLRTIQNLRIFLIKGVYKYSISSYIDGKEIKYNFYEDQLQLIDPKYAADYIHAYRKNAAKSLIQRNNAANPK